MHDDKVEWQGDLPPDAQQRREAFARFGLAMYAAQCVEKQIAILLSSTLNPGFLKVPQEERDRFFETEAKKTMGNLVKTMAERIEVPEDLHARMNEAMQIRNRLAHNYYWEKNIDILTRDGRESMIAELAGYAEFLRSLDEELTQIGFDWLESFGIDAREMVSEIMNELKDDES